MASVLLCQGTATALHAWEHGQEAPAVHDDDVPLFGR
jgi:hypothetical protein